MPEKIDKKTKILSDVVRALMHPNVKVQVQTVFAKQTERGTYYMDVNDNSEHALNRRGKFSPGSFLHGTSSQNREFANSIKINKDIQIQKKDETNRFIVHTPSGELNLSRSDKDMMALWSSALYIYDWQKRITTGRAVDEATRTMGKTLQNPILKDIANGDRPAPEDKKSKFEMATEQLKSLGIDPSEKLIQQLKARHFEDRYERDM